MMTQHSDDSPRGGLSLRKKAAIIRGHRGAAAAIAREAGVHPSAVSKILKREPGFREDKPWVQRVLVVIDRHVKQIQRENS